MAIATLSLSAITASAQITTNDLLEQLQVDSNTPLMELNVGQLIKVVQKAPLIQATCVDFSSFYLGQSFNAGVPINVNGVVFTSYYNGGARISEWPGSSNNFLEMVQDGAVLIDLPQAASEVTLELIQAGNVPNVADFYSYGSHVGSLSTSQYNQIDQLVFTGSDINTISINNPELLISQVCYQ